MNKKWVILAVMSLLVTACLGPVKTPTIAKYTLATIPSPSQPQRGTHGTLAVNIPLASADYQSKQMLYTQGNIYQLRAFAKNQWTAPPALLLEPLIVQNLRDSGYFRAVVAAPQLALTDWRLDTQLFALRQDFSPMGSQVCLVLQAQIINSHTDKVIAQQRFVANVPAPYRSPEGGVIAANQATQQVLRQLTHFVISTVSKNRQF
jgi:cholesterol transport system auxiliary component